VQQLISFLGRLFLCAIFLGSGVNKLGDPFGTMQMMKDVGGMHKLLPQYPQVDVVMVLFFAAVTFELLGGVMVLFGFKARTGAFLLATFLVLATYFFHPVWKIPASDPTHQMQMINFLKNVAILGGLLLVLANGPGAASVDNIGQKRRIDDVP
jgi:putative oxidoreductase